MKLRKRLVRFASLLLLMGAAAVSGCVNIEVPVNSVYPFCMDSTAIFDERLLGVWVSDDTDGSLEFSDIGENRYLVLAQDPDDQVNPTQLTVARLSVIDTTRYVLLS